MRNTEANAVHITSAAIVYPAHCPNADRAISATSCTRTIALSFTCIAASRIEGSADKFITTYSTVTNSTDSRIARGIVFSGCFTSLPRNVML